MSDTKFDPTKPAQTRDGRSVRILCTDRKGDYPIVGLVGSSSEEVYSWFANGLWSNNHTSHDLINVEPRVEEYRNLYDVDRQKLASAWHSGRDVALGYAAYVADNGFQPICTLKRTREGSRVISVEVVDFAKEVQQ